VGEDTSLERVLEILDTLTGDLLHGQLLYLGQERSAQNTTLGCGGCHEAAEGEDAPIGPPTGARGRAGTRNTACCRSTKISRSPISPPKRSSTPTRMSRSPIRQT